ncbi:hypothetical protein R4K54_12700 [Brachyspira murdochii]|uniref:Uncharacterized protein n=1 Tax=Brachyspira murdochii TaxID=84378 RepID=A0ABX5B8W9_9SPIR|nr:hypothetical protein [Brachyspira murdochii]PPS23103.1 hypothetical protein DJ52_00985 [Brachyspira murdochii]
MPASWKELEQKCFNYLQSIYKNVNFNLVGGSNSNISDIKVIDKNFFIEVKSPSAQCGQFVVLENENNFQYSDKNKTSVNQYSNYIIDYMNMNFEVFHNVGTKGVYLEGISKEIFYSWIIDFYKAKNTKYFITKKIDYIIIPLEKIHEYFYIKACYRVKKSGSSDPSNKNIEEIIYFLENYNIEFKLEIDGKKLYIITEYNIVNKIKINDYTYQFNKISEYKYNVRRLSNTSNANVIFSIKLIKNYQEEEDLISFLEDIKS